MMSGHSPIITSSIIGDDIMNKVSDPFRIAVVMEGRNVLTTSDNGYTAYEPVAAFFQSAEAEKVAGKMPQSKVVTVPIVASMADFEEERERARRWKAWNAIPSATRELLGITEPTRDRA